MSATADVPALVARARAGHRGALGRLITLVERGGAPADEVAAHLPPPGRPAHVVGVTGPPGAGKSCLVGALLAALAAAGRSPAVLAVDPSSPLTGGAILGDRVRMDARAGGAYVRSMATRGQAGGLALAVPGALRVLEAAGHDPLLVETAGVGQVEVDVAGAADTTVLVLAPGWGDAIQAGKAGLLELADVIVVNKADRPGADALRRDLEVMRDLGRHTGLEARSGRRPAIVMTTATTGDGAEALQEAVDAHAAGLGDGAGRGRRRARLEVAARARGDVEARLDALLAAPAGRALVDAVAAGGLAAPEAARRLVAALVGAG
ncbi:MAG TPA: methylmalonyl Co-A mutase-associated GTPase MeaB [Miltoncostaeaceae bacterium]|nr:methylmalonyl Co-A mutase-associated GTPase MeaB [Miltoncostaeaceae bacterium]